MVQPFKFSLYFCLSLAGRTSGDPRKSAMVMSSYYSAAEAIAVIKKQQEDAIVAQYTDPSAKKETKEQEDAEDAEYTRH
ncbi:hypothetical protein HDU87_005019 [Geranomyces variabilis]|uniref:Uncharacterized protein n=1 Tax=Geranomyces variabilis TaxID=109894 RepID=A0AAD5TQH3_9FUNG|nr:hypothetical protein HDU87_005019 [Geranomyces variabilis]